jgi:hypothetical protein
LEFVSVAYLESIQKGKAWTTSSALEIVIIKIIDPFPHPSMRKAQYVFTIIDD